MGPRWGRHRTDDKQLVSWVIQNAGNVIVNLNINRVFVMGGVILGTIFKFKLAVLLLTMYNV